MAELDSPTQVDYAFASAKQLRIWRPTLCYTLEAIYTVCHCIAWVVPAPQQWFTCIQNVNDCLYMCIHLYTRSHPNKASFAGGLGVKVDIEFRSGSNQMAVMKVCAHVLYI